MNHNAPFYLPKICITIVFDFLGTTVILREIATTIVQNFGVKQGALRYMVNSQ